MIEIRTADKTHIGALAEIERAAASLFSAIDLPDNLREETVSTQEHIEAQHLGLLLVALEGGTTPVGFAITQEIGSDLHLLELDVHPRCQRQGIGTGLLNKVFELARNRGYSSVTLTTFLHVPWNAPWYARKGFRILCGDEIDEPLKAILDNECVRGLDPARRVAMRWEVD